MKDKDWIDIYKDIILEYFGECVDEGNSTVSYHFYPYVDTIEFMDKLYKAHKQLQACQEQVATKSDECEELRDICDDVAKLTTEVECNRHFIDGLLSATGHNEYEYKTIHEEDAESLIEEINQEFNELKEDNKWLEQENTDLKQQLDTAVEALDKIEEYRPRLHQFNLSSIDFEDMLDIAKTALDKVKENNKF